MIDIRVILSLPKRRHEQREHRLDAGNPRGGLAEALLLLGFRMGGMVRGYHIDAVPDLPEFLSDLLMPERGVDFQEGIIAVAFLESKGTGDGGQPLPKHFLPPPPHWRSSGDRNEDGRGAGILSRYPPPSAIRPPGPGAGRAPQGRKGRRASPLRHGGSRAHRAHRCAGACAGGDRREELRHRLEGAAKISPKAIAPSCQSPWRSFFSSTPPLTAKPVQLARPASLTRDRKDSAGGDRRDSIRLVNDNRDSSGNSAQAPALPVFLVTLYTTPHVNMHIDGSQAVPGSPRTAVSDPPGGGIRHGIPARP